MKTIYEEILHDSEKEWKKEAENKKKKNVDMILREGNFCKEWYTINQKNKLGNYPKPKPAWFHYNCPVCGRKLDIHKSPKGRIERYRNGFSLSANDFLFEYDSCDAVILSICRCTTCGYVYANRKNIRDIIDFG